MELQFNDLPKAVTQLCEDMAFVKQHLLTTSNESQTIDRWLDLSELTEYDPEKRTKPTFYRYVQRSEIPFHKRGKKLIFLKSEIDTWLKQGRRKTIVEIASEANTYVKIKGGK